NLIVESNHVVGNEVLRAMLLQRIKASKKPFGLYFEEITGGFTMTGRTIPNAFTVTPDLMYRIYPDGRQEMVRGVDMIGTMSSLSNIVATGDRPCVFNGICGSESGSVPVAAVSPELLISDVEVQKKEKAQDKLPILPSPGETAPAGGVR
ncbi:MAG: hypothetical protein PHC61_18050, partial [Chitinivibrionales bacterium]|nr:hypothetical protein [Chitinivibrionales bacterium]